MALKKKSSFFALNFLPLLLFSYSHGFNYLSFYLKLRAIIVTQLIIKYINVLFEAPPEGISIDYKILIAQKNYECV